MRGRACTLSAVRFSCKSCARPRASNNSTNNSKLKGTCGHADETCIASVLSTLYRHKQRVVVTRTLYVYAKQKHLGCKKGEINQKQQLHLAIHIHANKSFDIC